MNNPFEYIPDAACGKAFQLLLDGVEMLRRSSRPEDVCLCRELDAGKMVGVLVAVDDGGAGHTLCAFSGQIGEAGFHHRSFVGPVFDYLQPDGYFRRREAEISRRNLEIARFEEDVLAKARKECEEEEKRLKTELTEYRERCRRSKMERDTLRKSGEADDAVLAALLRQSQFEKAEIHRMKKRMAARLSPYALRLKDAQERLDEMKAMRRADSEALQKWLFDNFRVLDARGESRSLSEIFAETPMGVPPSGAGECCAPKLLQAAFARGWRPVSMAEYWYGAPKGGEVRIHGRHYSACRGKCLPVLRWMLQGLDITPPLDSEVQAAEGKEPEVIFENEWFCVVDKPGGMLSVPGKGAASSVQTWLDGRYGRERQVKVAHRLDQDTSGLLMAAFGPEAYRVLQSLFATRQIRKTYVADLEGDWRDRGLPGEGRVNLPLSPDWLDRPRQKVDLETGKEAVTEYAFREASLGMSRVEFHPLTGRTHQLRVHSASPEGLGMPIVGDRLYGRLPSHVSERLHLHAGRLEFRFPLDGREYRFESPVPF